MAPDNVETLRRYVDLLNETGDVPVELLQPDVEMHMFRGSPISGPYEGHDGVRRWREDTFDVFQDWRMELDEVVPSGDPDVLVAIHRFVGHMRHTELPSNFPLAVVVRFHDGLIARFDGFRDREEAVDAARGGRPVSGDQAERAREWVHSAQAAVCDVVEPWEHGTVVRATRHPTYWDYNVVRVEDDVEIPADEIVRVADSGLEGLAHRRVGFEFAGRGEPLRAELERLGWKVTRLVWMRHEGRAPAETGLDVEQVHYDTVRHLRLAWHNEDFPSVDVAGHLEEAKEVDTKRQPEVFAAFERDRPIAFAQLERAGDAAEISSVYVDIEHRGRGLGTALTKAAIAAAGEVSDLWIVADDEDRPKELYARLGFRPVWKLFDFLRLPPG